MKYRIRCGDRYYCGMAWKDGKASPKWEKNSCFSIPVEMNFSDAEYTLWALINSEKYTETPVLEEVK